MYNLREIVIFLMQSDALLFLAAWADPGGGHLHCE